MYEMMKVRGRPPLEGGAAFGVAWKELMPSLKNAWNSEAYDEDKRVNRKVYEKTAMQLAAADTSSPIPPLRLRSVLVELRTKLNKLQTNFNEALQNAKAGQPYDLTDEVAEWNELVANANPLLIGPVNVGMNDADTNALHDMISQSLLPVLEDLQATTEAQGAAFIRDCVQPDIVMSNDIRKSILLQVRSKFYKPVPYNERRAGPAMEVPQAPEVPDYDVPEDYVPPPLMDVYDLAEARRMEEGEEPYVSRVTPAQMEEARRRRRDRRLDDIYAPGQLPGEPRAASDKAQKLDRLLAGQVEANKKKLKAAFDQLRSSGRRGRVQSMEALQKSLDEQNLIAGELRRMVVGLESEAFQRGETVQRDFARLESQLADKTRESQQLESQLRQELGQTQAQLRDAQRESAARAAQIRSLSENVINEYMSPESASPPLPFEDVGPSAVTVSSPVRGLMQRMGEALSPKQTPPPPVVGERPQSKLAKAFAQARRRQTGEYQRLPEPPQRQEEERQMSPPRRSPPGGQSAEAGAAAHNEALFEGKKAKNFKERLVLFAEENNVEIDDKAPAKQILNRLSNAGFRLPDDFFTSEFLPSQTPPKEVKRNRSFFNPFGRGRYRQINIPHTTKGKQEKGNGRYRQINVPHTTKGKGRWTDYSGPTPTLSKTFNYTVGGGAFRDTPMGKTNRQTRPVRDYDDLDYNDETNDVQETGGMSSRSEMMSTENNLEHLNPDWKGLPRNLTAERKFPKLRKGYTNPKDRY